MTLLHVSISAENPERVSTFLATLLGGEALPFPPFPDSWIAFAGQDDGTAIEVYPLTHRLKIGPEAIACEAGPPDASPSFAHVAIRSAFGREEVLARGAAEGWTTRLCNRGPFDCVEMWLENRLLVEVLDPAMQRDYARGMTMQNWRRMFGLG
ncbi:VOC family protein [Histidinibacterium lentulum]|uniref:VOC family protein n=1 Tax=Histidinibacterium lentulum TaxID=2480588 RepID=UPI00160B4BCD|nr:hypothetical protein [Histidinibacterium lentulum]